MQPPWIAHPELELGSIGWRMGYGEDYYNRFYRWYSGLEANVRAIVRQDNPAPAQWEGFYEMIEKHPWI